MSKVRDLPELTTLADDDLLYGVDSSAGVNGGRKVKISTIAAKAAADTKAVDVDYQRDNLLKKDIQVSTVDAENALNDLDDFKLSRSGSQPMTGDLNMDTHAISNVTTVNSVVVEAHASRHQPGGADAISTAAPTVNLSPATGNAEGSGTSLARNDHSHALEMAMGGDLSTINAGDVESLGSAGRLPRADHQHPVSTAAPVAIGTANSEGAATSLARSNHVHDHGSQSVGTHHAAVTTSVNGFMAAADKVKLDAMVFGFLSYTNSANQTTTQNNTAFTAIIIDSDTGSFANSLLTKTSTTQVRADFTGYLRVSYRVEVQNTSTNDRSVRVTALKNGTAVPSTQTRTIGKTNADRYGSVAGSFLLPCTTNDLFTIGYSNAEATVTDSLTIFAGGATINVEAIYKTA